jgi:hypothetical protein
MISWLNILNKTCFLFRSIEREREKNIFYSRHFIFNSCIYKHRTTVCQSVSQTCLLNTISLLSKCLINNNQISPKVFHTMQTSRITFDDRYVFVFFSHKQFWRDVIINFNSLNSCPLIVLDVIKSALKCKWKQRWI